MSVAGLAAKSHETCYVGHNDYEASHSKEYIGWERKIVIKYHH